MPRTSVKRHRRPPVQIDVAIGVITRNRKLLICQRKENDSFGGFWEFPGGKREKDESLKQCLRRELREELAISAVPFAELTSVEHKYPNVTVKLYPFVCTLSDDSEPQLIECQQAVWITPDQLTKYRFPPANESLIAEVVGFLTGRPVR